MINEVSVWGSTEFDTKYKMQPLLPCFPFSLIINYQAIERIVLMYWLCAAAQVRGERRETLVQSGADTLTTHQTLPCCGAMTPAAHRTPGSPANCSPAAASRPDI